MLNTSEDLLQLTMQTLERTKEQLVEATNMSAILVVERDELRTDKSTLHTNIRSDAQFILVVEKDAAFMRLAEDRFYNSYPCIIITGKGQPDVATRLFLKRISETLNIPVLFIIFRYLIPSSCPCAAAIKNNFHALELD